MWPKTFAERLESWTQLRRQASTADAETALNAINSWWFQTPWRAYHLHWDDRALGILYTITMLDRPDLQDAVLVEVDSDNLVLVHEKKYILNWDSEQMLNITLGRFNSRHSITQEQLKQQIR
jgi:hypothetical protein